MSLANRNAELVDLIRPDRLESMLIYLDDLRSAGIVNMFGARPYLQGAFPNLSGREAGAVLAHWMMTFEDTFDARQYRRNAGEFDRVQRAVEGARRDASPPADGDDDDC